MCADAWADATVSATVRLSLPALNPVPSIGLPRLSEQELRALAALGTKFADAKQRSCGALKIYGPFFPNNVKVKMKGHNRTPKAFSAYKFGENTELYSTINSEFRSRTRERNRSSI